MLRLRLSTIGGCAIVALLVGASLWAAMRQPLWEWSGLTRAPDNAWTIVTLLDLYCGLMIFYSYIIRNERTVAARAGWFVAIVTLGNIATAAYLLFNASRLPSSATPQKPPPPAAPRHS
jgi:hypothetical protein